MTAVHSQDGDIWPISRLLVEKYVGRNDPQNAEAVEKFYANMKTEPRLLFRLTPAGPLSFAARAVPLWLMALCVSDANDPRLIGDPSAYTITSGRRSPSGSSTAMESPGLM